jgi:mono/diheme cytochrome c family protein
MAYRSLIAAALLALAWPGASRAEQPPFPLKSQTVVLPASTQAFPGGAAADPVSTNCVTCHSPGMVLNQPNLSKAAWEAEVRKMINVYKAPIADAAVAPIVVYLVQIKGAN